MGEHRHSPAGSAAYSSKFGAEGGERGNVSPNLGPDTTAAQTLIARLRKRAEAGNADLADDTSCIVSYEEITALLDLAESTVPSNEHPAARGQE